MGNESTTTSFDDIQKGGVIVVPWLDGMALGAGYDSLAQVPKGDPSGEGTDLTLKSVSGTSSQTFTEEIKRIQSSQQLSDSLVISASAYGSFAGFSASASGKYIHSTTVNNYSLYFLIKSFVRNSEKQITSYALSKTALQMDGNAFKTEFGDYFVEGVISGGTFYALLQLSTNSRETKEKILTSLEASYSGGFSVGGKFSMDISKALKTSGVTLSATVKATGATPKWNASHSNNTVKDMLASAKSFPTGVANAGGPIFAILKPYALLQNPPKSSTSIESQAVYTIRQTIMQIYLQSKQILDSVNYALSNPDQFPPNESKNLEKIQQQMLDVQTGVEKASQELDSDPTAKITLPKMPSLDEIPKRLWGGTLQAIAPPENVVPTTIRYKIGAAQRRVWSLSGKALQETCQDYLNKVESEIQSNLEHAYNFIQTLSDSIAALNNGIAKSSAQELTENLANLVAVGAAKWSSAIAEQRAMYESFSNQNTGGQLDFLEKGLNPVLWDTSGSSVTYGGAAFWGALKTNTTDELTTIVDTWPASGTTSGTDYFSFKSGLWSMLGADFREAMNTLYNSE